MLRTVKWAVKQTGAGFLYRAGVFERTPRPQLTVLGYHRVVDERLPDHATSPLGMIVTPRTFERQLGYAGRRYRMVSLAEIEAAADGRRPLPARAAFVTFDDGWEDNYRVAFPILSRLGIPAAVFVTTDYVGGDRAFWFTRLMLSLLRGRHRLEAGVGRALGWPANLAQALDRLAAFGRPIRPWEVDALIEAMKDHPEPAIEDMVDALAARLGGPGREAPGARYFLTWDEIREMERGGVGFGSHSCTHRILTRLADDEAVEEFGRSRERLEKELGHPVVSFAFPNGDYRPAHMTMAREAGYRCFFVSSRVRPGGPAGRVFARPCVHEGVGQGAAGGFSPALMELHLSGFADRVRGPRE
jgi:peptidoglycan/xylan/chitin deacetylase (PgdA/CDA1 family)